MTPDSGGVLRLPWRLPQAVADDLLLTGRRMPAPEAERWGLVNRVVDGPDLLETALGLARDICAGAPLAVAAIKEILRTTANSTIEEGYEHLRHGDLPAYRAMLTSDDAEEGPRAFAEKRTPRWTGR